MAKITITLSQAAEDKLRRCNRKKGDLSRIVETLIMEHLDEPDNQTTKRQKTKQSSTGQS